jgi:excisionase family DNA binding protein
MAEPMSSSYTVHDLCERFGVGEHTVLTWIRSGELKAVNVGRAPAGKRPRWRITEAALEAFELLRTPSPLPPRTKRRKRPPEVIEFYK